MTNTPKPKHPGGRPRQDVCRVVRKRFALTPDEDAEFRRRVAASGMSASRYIRERVLGAVETQTQKCRVIAPGFDSEQFRAKP